MQNNTLSSGDDVTLTLVSWILQVCIQRERVNGAREECKRKLCQAVRGAGASTTCDVIVSTIQGVKMTFPYSVHAHSCIAHSLPNLPFLKHVLCIQNLVTKMTTIPTYVHEIPHPFYFQEKSHLF